MGYSRKLPEGTVPGPEGAGRLCRFPPRAAGLSAKEKHGSFGYLGIKAVVLVWCGRWKKAWILR